MRRTYVLVASFLAFVIVACSPAAPSNDETATSGQPSTRVEAHAAPRQLAPDGTSWSVYITVDLGTGVSKVCAGSLVSRQAVLTAAHCVERDDGSIAPPGAARTLVGAGDALGRPTVARSVVAIDLHPQRAYRYVGTDVVASSYDAALLTLAQPVNSSPLPLAVDAASVAPGPITTYGYGYVPAQTPMNADGTRSSLATVSPPGKLGIALCGDRDVSPDHLCMASADPAVWGTAPGDSGGPWVRSVRGADVQVAVTSYGAVDVPGDSVGTSVLDILPWVRSAAGLLQVPAGTVLRDPASGSAWRVHRDGYRRLVPTSATLDCLVDAGVPVIDQDVYTIEQIPESVGDTESCSVAAGSVAQRSVEATPPTPAPSPSVTIPPTSAAAVTVASPTSPSVPTTAAPLAAVAAAPSTPPVAAGATAEAPRRSSSIGSLAVWTYDGPTPSSSVDWLAITGGDARLLFAGALLLLGAGLAMVAVQLRLRRSYG